MHGASSHKPGVCGEQTRGKISLLQSMFKRKKREGVNQTNLKCASFFCKKKKKEQQGSIPSNPFAIHIRSFTANVRLKRSFENGSPVQITLVVFDLVFFILVIWQRRCGSCLGGIFESALAGRGIGRFQLSLFFFAQSCAGRVFSSLEPGTEIWPVTGRIERLPPVDANCLVAVF